MSEIDKLRQRLANIGKNVTEYRMSVTEAKNLVAEFDEYAKRIQATVQLVAEPAIINRVLDGGSF